MQAQLLSGNEAVALAALHGGVALGAGYPGTPSTEILEHFHSIGGHAQWAPNEKVALEVAVGAAFGSAGSHGDNEARGVERGGRRRFLRWPTAACPARC